MPFRFLRTASATSWQSQPGPKLLDRRTGLPSDQGCLLIDPRECCKPSPTWPACTFGVAYRVKDTAVSFDWPSSQSCCLLVESKEEQNSSPSVNLLKQATRQTTCTSLTALHWGKFNMFVRQHKVPVSLSWFYVITPQMSCLFLLRHSFPQPRESVPLPLTELIWSQDTDVIICQKEEWPHSTDYPAYPDSLPNPSGRCLLCRRRWKKPSGTLRFKP